MNPPFGKIRQEDGRIKTVKVDGYSINVTDHFEVDGKMYNRQGASWPIRVISINGRAESDKISPATGVVQRVNDWGKLYERFTASLDANEHPHAGKKSTGNGAITTPEGGLLPVNPPYGRKNQKIDSGGDKRRGASGGYTGDSSRPVSGSTVRANTDGNSGSDNSGRQDRPPSIPRELNAQQQAEQPSAELPKESDATKSDRGPGKRAITGSASQFQAKYESRLAIDSALFSTESLFTPSSAGKSAAINGATNLPIGVSTHAAYAGCNT